MNAMIRILSILILWQLLTVSDLLAQDFTSKNRKAIKYYMEGEQELRTNRNMELAMVNFKLAVEEDPRFIEAHIMLADIYNRMGKKEELISTLTNVVAIDPTFRSTMIFALAEAEMSIGRYEDARKHYEYYLPFGRQNEKLSARAKMDLKCIEFAKEHINKPVPFNPINMGKAINSKFDEYFPCVTVDDNVFLYTRRLDSPGSPLGYNEDFFESEKDGDWMLSKNLGTPINTNNNEGAPALSADGRVLVFTACETYGNYGPGRNGYGSCDLFVSQRKGNNWSRPLNLGKPINSQHWETQPSLTSDGRTIYFIRGYGRGNEKDQDIYVSTYTDEGNWTKPLALNNNINTPFREESVFIHPDGQTIYFASDGHPGMGGLDLFMSKKDSSGDWGLAVNLGYPINTFNDENSLLVDAEGKYGYFASNREEGEGGLDLYRFDLPSKVQPEAVTYLKGKVYNAETKKPISTKFELIDLESGEVSVRAYSDEYNGSYLIAIPSGKNYALNASKPGYLFYSDNFSLKGVKDKSKPFEKNVPLQPIKVGAKTVLNNIFFDTDKYDLKKASEVELQKLITFLSDNPQVKIELSGHTDNVGNDDYNQKLSENRAKSVYTFLVEKGVDPARLTFKGYGEKLPVASNETVEGRAQNRRTEFKIIAN